MFMNQEYVCSITPTEFEKYCLEILAGFAEEEQLTDFSITHNVKIPVEDGTYQIDIYAVFMAMGVEFKILCECKQYSAPVNREKVAALHSKLNSIERIREFCFPQVVFKAVLSNTQKYMELH